MTERLKIIFSALPDCEKFADVGCDHGYIAKAMLKSGKCKSVIVSDISANCLIKAERLLFDEIKSGTAESVVSNGFEKVKGADLALIAGMGGEEIVNIILSAKELPFRLALQPMKNCEKVRKIAVQRGYRVLKDFLFKSAGKFYDFILLEKGEEQLTEEEILFGRDNLIEKGQAFKEFIRTKIRKINLYLENDALKGAEKERLIQELERLNRYA